MRAGRSVFEDKQDTLRARLRPSVSKLPIARSAGALDRLASLIVLLQERATVRYICDAQKRATLMTMCEEGRLRTNWPAAVTHEMLLGY